MRYHKALATLVIVVLALLSMSIPALADHNEFMNRDPNWQTPPGLPPPAGDWPEHGSYNKWYIYSPYWPHDPNHPLYSVTWQTFSEEYARTKFQTGLERWRSALDGYGIHWVMFKDVTFQSGNVIDLEVYGGGCPDGRPACMGVMSLQGATPSNANRLLKAVIYTGVYQNYGNEDQRISTVVHEIGHLLNLDDRYHHSGSACNNSENTVMDALYTSGGQVWSCDNTGYPANTDKARIELEYTKGQCTSAGTPQQSGNNLISFWFDQAYENWSHNLNFYKKEGGGWTWKGIGDEISLVGTEYGTVARVVINNRANVKTAWGTGTYYVSCRPRNGAKNDGTILFGLTSDSPQVTIN